MGNFTPDRFATGEQPTTREQSIRICTGGEGGARGITGSILGLVLFDRFINGRQNPNFPAIPTNFCLLIRIDTSSPRGVTQLSAGQPLEQPHPQKTSLDQLLGPE